MVAHYLEREAAGEGGESQQDLLIVPGFTMEMSQMAALVLALKPPANWRIVVMELPRHGRNAVQFVKNGFPSFTEVLLYTRAFVKAVRLGSSAPLSICGYSLGGGIW